MEEQYEESRYWDKNGSEKSAGEERQKYGDKYSSINSNRQSFLWLVTWGHTPPKVETQTNCREYI